MTPHTPIYLDNAATTRCSAAAARAVEHHLRTAYGNPSSAHPLGAAAAEVLEATRRCVQTSVQARRARVVFTSGGTEANNLALMGAASAHGRRHLLVSTIEHDSVRQPAEALARAGFELEWIRVDRDGRIDAAEVVERVRPDTALVCVQHGNNEIGTLQPIAAIARGVHDRNRRTIVHVDAVQSLAWERLDFEGWGLDSLSISGHKIQGPKGVGALVLRENLVLEPRVHGGGQEGGLRSGTENVPGIAGLAAALEEVLTHRSTRRPQVEALRDRLAHGIAERVPDAHRHTPASDTLPHLLSIAFPGVTGEVLLHHLEAEGIYVSTGSACHASSAGGSHVLKAIGASPPDTRSTLRFSISHETRVDEIERVLAVLPEAVAELRLLEA